MEIKEMTVEELEARKTAIAAEVDAEGADLDALETEVRAIKAELEERKAAEAKKAEIRSAVAAGAGKVVKTFEEEKTKMPTIDEIRSSKKYIDAYANYLKTGRDAECRAILTETAYGEGDSGPVPVPVFIDEFVRTAWESDPIMSRVRRTFVRGNLRVAFERSADPASIHDEGDGAPNPENLVLGIVKMVPTTIKKWVTITDEAMTMGGEEFLRYIYDELTYRIVKKAADLGIEVVTSAAKVSGTGEIGVPVVEIETPGVTSIPTAAAYLSENASNPVVIMNRLTEIAFINAAAAGSYAIDPFAGLPRVYTSALKPYSETGHGETYAIVGDLRGLQYNYPDGDGVSLKYDDLSLAEQDLVKIVGRQYVGIGVTEPGMFVKITRETV